MNKLKFIRVIFALLFFISTIALFLPITKDYLDFAANKILFLQFIPSLFKFLSAFSLFSIGFFIVLLLTAFIGRFYCSAICPLGILQDIFTFIRKKISFKLKFKFKEEQKILRYAILGLTIITPFLTTMVVVNLLDPYSNFGRISSQLISPVFIFFNNLLASIFQFFGSFAVAPITYKSIRFDLLIFPFLFFLIIGYLSFKHGRLYCNTICPVGTLLGVISKYSLFKIKIEETKCKSCAKCEFVCKAECIDSRNKTVDVSRCVGCFNCLSVCPSNGIMLKLDKRESTKSTDENKRKFLKDISLFVLGSSILIKATEKIKVYKENTVEVKKTNYAVPPGSKGVEHFTDFCTACHLCVTACPTGVLQPAFLEHGFVGMLQPFMDNHKGFCNFECNLCSQICPSGAILPINLINKKLTQIGIAKFVKDNCIVYTEKTDCGACSEHCPTKAVKMEPIEGGLVAPKVYSDYCIGCGACEYACPTKPYKAIYVEGNYTHLKAKPPVLEQVKPKTITEDFPF